MDGMIVGVGADVAEVARIRRSKEQFGSRFLDRIFTPEEQSYSLAKANWAERLAARFAAKEAALKAIGTGWDFGITFRDVEVTNDENGKPSLRFHGPALEKAESLGVNRFHLSLSHTADVALAVVVLESA